MTLFVANGEICSVAKADCPKCHGVGWRFTELEKRNGMIGRTLTVCNCIEVHGRSEVQRGGEMSRAKKFGGEHEHNE